MHHYTPFLMIRHAVTRILNSWSAWSRCTSVTIWGCIIWSCVWQLVLDVSTWCWSRITWSVPCIKAWWHRWLQHMVIDDSTNHTHNHHHPTSVPNWTESKYMYRAEEGDSSPMFTLLPRALAALTPPIATSNPPARSNYHLWREGHDKLKERFVRAGFTANYVVFRQSVVAETVIEYHPPKYRPSSFPDDMCCHV